MTTGHESWAAGKLGGAPAAAWAGQVRRLPRPERASQIVQRSAYFVMPDKICVPAASYAGPYGRKDGFE